MRQPLREAGQQFDIPFRILMEHELLLRGGVYRLRRKCYRLVERLRDRPEGFVDDGRLVAGRPYGALIRATTP